MDFHFEQGEILLMRKPYTWTSFDVIGKVRTIIRKSTGLRHIKVGHAGTLDPLASGLLILCTGKFTRRIEEFQGLEKEYTGTFRLGATTPSFDLETEVDMVYGDPLPSGEAIMQAATLFTGTLEQVPPQYSAIKIGGKRAYESARKDVEVELKPRTITIAGFEVTRIALPDVDFRVVCSKGTYIRALARDFGRHLGCGAHLTALCRTRIGPYRLEEAYSPDDLASLLAV